MAKARVLIVDDDERIRETLKYTLETAGYQVGVAASGTEGLEKFGTGEAWDLVLLDQRMAGLQGLEVLRRLHQVSSQVPVILLTAYGTIDVARGSLASGASAFLRKPMSPEELRRVVAEVLASHPGVRSDERQER